MTLMMKITIISMIAMVVMSMVRKILRNMTLTTVMTMSKNRRKAMKMNLNTTQRCSNISQGFFKAQPPYT